MGIGVAILYAFASFQAHKKNHIFKKTIKSNSVNNNNNFYLYFPTILTLKFEIYF